MSTTTVEIALGLQAEFLIEEKNGDILHYLGEADGL